MYKERLLAAGDDWKMVKRNIRCLIRKISERGAFVAH